MCLCSQWGCRVVAVNWGPWAKTGMVSEAVKQQFSDNGIHMIDPAAGSRYLLDEIDRGELSDAIVIAVGKGS